MVYSSHKRKMVANKTGSMSKQRHPPSSNFAVAPPVSKSKKKAKVVIRSSSSSQECTEFEPANQFKDNCRPASELSATDDDVTLDYHIPIEERVKMRRKKLPILVLKREPADVSNDSVALVAVADSNGHVAEKKGKKKKSSALCRCKAGLVDGPACYSVDDGASYISDDNLPPVLVCADTASETDCDNELRVMPCLAPGDEVSSNTNSDVHNLAAKKKRKRVKRQSKAEQLTSATTAMDTKGLTFPVDNAMSSPDGVRAGPELAPPTSAMDLSLYNCYRTGGMVSQPVVWPGIMGSKQYGWVNPAMYGGGMYGMMPPLMPVINYGMSGTTSVTQSLSTGTTTSSTSSASSSLISTSSSQRVSAAAYMMPAYMPSPYIGYMSPACLGYMSPYMGVQQQWSKNNTTSVVDKVDHNDSTTTLCGDGVTVNEVTVVSVNDATDTSSDGLLYKGLRPLADDMKLRILNAAAAASAASVSSVSTR